VPNRGFINLTEEKKHMRKRGLVLFIILLGVASSQSWAAEPRVIYVSQTAPFLKPSAIDEHIVESCALPAKQIESIIEEAKDDGTFKVLKDDEAVKANKGYVLEVKIENATPPNNAHMAIQGRLFENGTEIGNFFGVRRTMGGFGAGFKSTCTIISRCAEALGKDVVEWLKNPQKDSAWFNERPAKGSN
jgi:hypothetical protein